MINKNGNKPTDRLYYLSRLVAHRAARWFANGYEIVIWRKDLFIYFQNISEKDSKAIWILSAFCWKSGQHI